MWEGWADDVHSFTKVYLHFRGDQKVRDYEGEARENCAWSQPFVDTPALLALLKNRLRRLISALSDP